MSKRAHRVAVVGSTVFPINAELGAEIVDILRTLPDGTVILTRGKGNVDEFISHVAPLLGLRCLAYPSRGGSDNWNRDVELAKDADEAVVLFASNTLADTNTGTAHFAEKMLDAKKPVRAFTEVGNTLVFAGETD